MRRVGVGVGQARSLIDGLVRLHALIGLHNKGVLELVLLATIAVGDQAVREVVEVVGAHLDVSLAGGIEDLRYAEEGLLSFEE